VPVPEIVDYVKTHIPVDQFTHASSHGSEPGRRIVFHARVNHDGRIQLQKLKRCLTGVANVNPLPPTGRVRVVVSTIDTAHGGRTAFKAALKTLQSKTNSFIHAAVSIGPTINPIYFAGLDARTNLYIVVMGDPGDLRPVSKKDKSVPVIVKQLVDAGVFPHSLATIKRNAKDVHIVSDPSELVEIPSGVHRAYTKYIANGQNAGDAWIAAGGVTWSAALGLKFEFHELFEYDRTVPLTSIATLDTYVMKSLHRPVHGAAARKLESDPATAIAKSALQTLTTDGTRLGRGSYGTVYAITLDVRSLKLLADLKKSLSNMLEFAPYGGNRQVVLKVEKLESYMPMTEERRRRLVGESYIQQFVNDNRGLVTRAKSQLVVSPRVYFSGTIANSFNVICMDRVVGKLLSDVISDRRVVSECVYNALEAAIVTMLRNGVVHSDLHASNVFVSGSGRSTHIHILDFGFASLVPQAMKKKIANVLDRGGSVHDVFEQTGLANAVNATKRKFDYYHANDRLLTYVKKRQVPVSGLRSYPAWNANQGSTTTLPMLFKNIAKLSSQLDLPTTKRTKTKNSRKSNVPVATPAWPPITQTNRRVTVR
jgi:tRNA A-37 threonylcarbamoyl transferase component Bud32